MKSILFKFIIAILILFTSGIKNNAKAQLVLVPDSIFRLILNAKGFGGCLTGNYIDSACAAVKNCTSFDLNVNSGGPYSVAVKSLSGLEAFRNLTILSCTGTEATTLPVLSQNLKTITCSYSQFMDTMPVLPNSVTTINWELSSLKYIPVLPSSLQTIHCGGNKLTSLPALPSGIKFLYCSNNQITALPTPLPDSLTLFYCGSNLLTSLPPLPGRLKGLDCAYNQLTSLPSLPDSLQSLNCGKNQIDTLPTLSSQLIDFSCDENLLTELPVLPSQLQNIYCNNNLLSGIPNFPSSIREVYCNNNQITSLPSFPSLYKLNCSSNLLSTLPSGLATTVNCNNNLITSLPAYLCKNVITLNCDSNLLTSLPPLSAIKTFTCTYNNLKSISSVADSVGTLNCSFNPDLKCLPELKKVNYLFFNSTGINCLPNYGTIHNSSPLLSTLSPCGFFNPDLCTAFWNISGKTYFDNDNNCSFSTGDITKSNLKLNLYRNGNLIQQSFTGSEGYYSFNTDSLTIYETKIDTSGIPFDVYCPSSSFYTDTLTTSDSLKYDRDFALKCKNGFDLAATSIHANGFRPAKVVDVNISSGDYSNLYGAHCASGISGIVKVVLNGDISFNAPSIVSLVPNVSGDTLIYSVADFGIIDYTTAFNFSLLVDTNATLGSHICISAEISPLADNNPSNNFISQCFTVVSSFDPNEKQAYPENTLAINGDRWLTFTVNFQNTGTAPAENIYVTDTLDSNLDLSTFQLLAYSHQPYVQILDGGIAKFNFPNINLPDSLSDEPNSHGYVQYKIKAKANLPLGTLISNTANIYFDFNAPVITNTTVNEVISTVGLNENNLSFNFNLYPNPANDFIIIETTESTYNLTISDQLGRVISSAKALKGKYKLPVIQLSNGIYFISIQSQEGNKSTKKFLKY